MKPPWGDRESWVTPPLTNNEMLVLCGYRYDMNPKEIAAALDLAGGESEVGKLTYAIIQKVHETERRLSQG